MFKSGLKVEVEYSGDCPQQKAAEATESFRSSQLQFVFFNISIIATTEAISPEKLQILNIQNQFHC